MHDIRFEDNWESPIWCQSLWEVWLNGMEVAQFTYFQQVGGLERYPNWRDHLWIRAYCHVLTGS